MRVMYNNMKIYNKYNMIEINSIEPLYKGVEPFIHGSIKRNFNIHNKNVIILQNKIYKRY